VGQDEVQEGLLLGVELAADLYLCFGGSFFAGATGILVEDVINISKGLFEHRCLCRERSLQALGRD